MNLQEAYDSLLQKHKINIIEGYENITTVMRDSINDFMSAHKRVAIYCYGAHTKALMADYIYELRNIVCIIDNGDVDAGSQGYVVIKDEEIESMAIDGIIISSYLYKEEIKQSLKEKHEGVAFLDLYDDMYKRGIPMKCEFFKGRTPKQRYYEINQMYQKLNQGTDVFETLLDLVKKFIEIKDFRLAAQAAGALYESSGDQKYNILKKDVEDLYQKYLEVLKRGDDAVFLLCVDGLKAQEFCEGGRLRKTYSAVREKATIFTRAYSFSTSTFESLVPVFSEKYDQRLEGYLENTVVPLEECRFAKFAREQGRNIYVYGGGIKYIEDPQIKYIEHPQTIAQMLWSFAVDLELDSRGLFYMQPVSESHFTFCSPYYRQNDMQIDDTNLFYNYLSTKGNCLNTKYSRQYDVAMEYVDDTLAPVLEACTCKTLLFADHGGYDYEEIECSKLEDLDPNRLTASEDLIRIPIVIVSPKEGGEDHSLISLAELNDIAISMMKNEKFPYNGQQYIKLGRKAIYNADCKYIFNHIFHSEHRLCAFEGFIFEDGYKLLVFSDGTKELYMTAGDVMVQDEELKEKYYKLIERQLTIF